MIPEFQKLIRTCIKAQSYVNESYDEKVQFNWIAVRRQVKSGNIKDYIECLLTAQSLLDFINFRDTKLRDIKLMEDLDARIKSCVDALEVNLNK